MQRVWLASCLAQQTPVLLLDEPTTYLDLRYQVEILDLVRDLADLHGVAGAGFLVALAHRSRGSGPTRSAPAAGAQRLRGARTASVIAARVPRVLAALLAGAALAAAGTTIQAVCRNPLAEPGILGVSGGAGIGAVPALAVSPLAGVGVVTGPAAGGPWSRACSCSASPARAVWGRTGWC